MLRDFQQALADLTASPALCTELRAGTLDLAVRYELTERERRRLVAMVGHAGMACACMLYRANRLAPLALNVPALCSALGAGLRDAVSAYWAAYPHADGHFYAETERFCRYLDGQPDLPAAVRTVLARDLPRMAALLEMSRTEDADARYAASGTVQAS